MLLLSALITPARPDPHPPHTRSGTAAFATPRDDLRLSAEADAFADALDRQPGSDEGGGCGGEEGEGGGGGEYGDALGPEAAWAAEYGAPLEGGGPQDSYGLPSEASLFQDLSSFLKETTGRDGQD